MLVESKPTRASSDRATTGAPAAVNNRSLGDWPLHRVPVLDGVRATAILLVLFGHTVHKAYLPLGALFGEYGTSLFFVLSGYLITTALLADEARHGRVRLVRFYRRRALRILPALTVFLLVLAALVQIGILEKRSPLSWIASALYFRNLAGTGWEHAAPLDTCSRRAVLFPVANCICGVP